MTKKHVYYTTKKKETDMIRTNKGIIEINNYELNNLAFTTNLIEEGTIQTPNLINTNVNPYK